MQRITDSEWDELMSPWRQLARTTATAKRERLSPLALDTVSHEDPLGEPVSRRWVVAGDTHGSAHHVTSMIDEVAAAGMDRLLILGDVAGTRPDQVEGFLDWVSRACMDNHVTTLWIDGNHDPHRGGVLDRCPVDPRTGTRPVRPSVHHLPRGLRWQWGQVRYCVAGGAVSVDRSQRAEGVTVFTAEEELTEAEATAIAAAGQCDVLFSHDRPAWVELALGHARGSWWEDAPGVWAEEDFHRSLEHQARLDRLVSALRPRWQLHGHLHRRYDLVSSATPWGGPCRITGLANEGQKYLNRVVVSTRPELADLTTVSIEELR